MSFLAGSELDHRCNSCTVIKWGLNVSQHLYGLFNLHHGSKVFKKQNGPTFWNDVLADKSTEQNDIPSLLLPLLQSR